MREILYLYFDGLDRPLQLIRAEHLIDHFPALFPDWDFHARSGEHHEKPIITINFKDNAYHLSISWADEVKRYTDTVDILCALVAKLAKASSFKDTASLYLHAASVMINGRLVVFPSQHQAGKSFLTTCLTAAGCTFFGDDVFPLTLEHCQGRALGFSPCLRVPIPDTTDTESKRFIEQHTALRGERFAFLTLEQKDRVAKNNSLDIGAFVLLQRQEGMPAQLEELPAVVVFKRLIKQNFAREVDGSRILSTLTQAISQAQCLTLNYDRADEAVTLLKAHFSEWPVKSEPLLFESTSKDSGVEKETSQKKLKDSFVQNRQAKKITIEGETFLTSPDGKAIYHLNPIASGIWALLAGPISEKDAVSTLTTAFPQIKKATIEKDVRKIFKTFISRRLIKNSSA